MERAWRSCRRRPSRPSGWPSVWNAHRRSAAESGQNRSKRIRTRIENEGEKREHRNGRAFGTIEQVRSVSVGELPVVSVVTARAGAAARSRVSLARASLFLTVCVLASNSSEARQQPVPDTVVVRLEGVVVEATRAELAADRMPMSVAVLSLPPEQAAAPPRSLSEALAALPGVFLGNRQNMALGERIMIRGMGWRSAFGVRGIQVLLDGIPLTMPDGQTTMDVLEPAAVTRAEVIRGPSSLLWGNAGGGVLYLSSQASEAAPHAEVGVSTGSYGLRRLDGRYRLGTARSGVSGYVTVLDQDGYRAYSRTSRVRSGLHAVTRVSSTWSIGLDAAFLHAPTTENPGGLTRLQFENDPRQPDPRYPATRSKEDATQLQVGLSASGMLFSGWMSTLVYGVARRLENPLPFAYIRLRRAVGGARVTWLRQFDLLRWTLGADLGLLRDDRGNWDNAGGAPGDDHTLDQIETVGTAAVFSQVHLDMGSWVVQAGGRVDRLRFAADDRLLDNGDQSGHRSFLAFTPSAGITLPMEGATAYAGVSTSFESPTTTEFVNRPDTELGGFNPDLDPQRTLGAEVGLRNLRLHARLLAELAGYRMRVNGLLSPFQTDAGGDRTFYRNEGRTLHDGLEGGIVWTPPGDLSLRGWVTWNRFRFADGPNEGRRLPGLPAFRGFAELAWKPAPLLARVQAEWATDMTVDDAGSDSAEGVATAHVLMSWHAIPLSRHVSFTPFLSVRNILDASFVGSVVVNARGGRFFEPAAGRTWTVGLRMAV